MNEADLIEEIESSNAKVDALAGVSKNKAMAAINADVKNFMITPE